MPVQHKPIIHGGDHAAGGADPIPGLFGGVYRDAVLTIPGLWAYWPMNGPVGTWDELVAGRDLTPHENPGAGYEFAVIEAGPFNEEEPENSVSFSGLDEGASRDLGTSADYEFAGTEAELFNGTHPFSILAWFYPYPPTDPVDHPELPLEWGATIANAGGGASSNWWLEIMPPDDAAAALDTGNAGTMIFTRGSVGVEIASSAEPYLASWPYHSSWNFVVVTYDGETITMYADGILAATGAAGSIAASTSHISLGRQKSDIGVSHYFNGEMAHVAVAADAMTPEQIQQLMAHKRGAAGTVPVSTGTGGVIWVPPGSIGGGPPADTRVWMPLYDSDGILVLDSDGGAIPTLIPIGG